VTTYPLDCRSKRPAGVRFALTFFCAMFLMHSPAAFALSEIKPEDGVSEIRREHLPAPEGTGPSVEQEDGAASEEPAGDQEPETPAAGEDNDNGKAENAPLPDVQYDLSQLPEPVRLMHERLVAAAKAGDIEMLRPLISTGGNTTQLTFGEESDDPIDFLRSMSGDGEGHEILAILEEVLDAGYVHAGVGTSEELYVWPYFFALPLDSLNPRQRVELFKIVTAGDYEEMKTYGAYVFYRVGITPEGEWAFFVAGD